MTNRKITGMIEVGKRDHASLKNFDPKYNKKNK